MGAAYWKRALARADGVRAAPGVHGVYISRPMRGLWIAEGCEAGRGGHRLDVFEFVGAFVLASALNKDRLHHGRRSSFRGRHRIETATTWDVRPAMRLTGCAMPMELNHKGVEAV